MKSESGVCRCRDGDHTDYAEKPATETELRWEAANDGTAVAGPDHQGCTVPSCPSTNYATVTTERHCQAILTTSYISTGPG